MCGVREGYRDLGLGRVPSWVKGLGADTQNSAFVYVLKKGQISIRSGRIKADQMAEQR